MLDSSPSRKTTSPAPNARGWETSATSARSSAASGAKTGHAAEQLGGLECAGRHVPEGSTTPGARAHSPVRPFRARAPAGGGSGAGRRAAARTPIRPTGSRIARAITSTPAMTSSTRPASPSASPGVQRSPGSRGARRSACGPGSGGRRWRRRPPGRARRPRARAGDAAGGAVERARSARALLVGRRLREPGAQPARSARASRTRASSTRAGRSGPRSAASGPSRCASLERRARPSSSLRGRDPQRERRGRRRAGESISELCTKPPRPSTTRIARSETDCTWSGVVVSVIAVGGLDGPVLEAGAGRESPRTLPLRTSAPEPPGVRRGRGSVAAASATWALPPLPCAVVAAAGVARRAISTIRPAARRSDRAERNRCSRTR